MIFREIEPIRSSKIVQIIREIKIKDLIVPRGRPSIAYHVLRANNKIKPKDLDNKDLMSISHFIDRAFMAQLINAVNTRLGPIQEDLSYSIVCRDKIKKLETLTSKMIRYVIISINLIITH